LILRARRARKIKGFRKTVRSVAYKGLRKVAKVLLYRTEQKRQAASKARTLACCFSHKYFP